MFFKKRKPPLILHIGLGKTGSTALQIFFSSNRRALKACGVDYPEYGEVAGAHHKLSPHIPPGLANTWSFQPVEVWAPILSGASAKFTLLSSELISSSSDAVAREFCSTVSESFDLRIVVYLRRQDNIIMASYNQHVKSGKQRNKLSAIYQNMVPRFDYTTTLRPWAESLGDENIVVRPYEKDQFHRQDIRLDFLYHVFGIDDDSAFELSRENPNPRLDRKLLEYKRMLNNIKKDAEKEHRLRNLMQQYSMAAPLGNASEGGQTLLPAETRHAIVRAHADDNREIARRFLQRADGELFLEPLPEVGEPWTETELSPEEVFAITRFFMDNDPTLMLSLARELEKCLDSDGPVRRDAARTLAAAFEGAM